MRRLSILLALSLVGAALAGFAASPVVRAPGVSVSDRAMREELSALAANPGLQCYLSAMTGQFYRSGGGHDSLSAAATANWTKLRVESAVIIDYVDRHGGTPTAADLTTARAALEQEFNAAAAARQYRCGTSPAAALDALPPAMLAFQLHAQADAMWLDKMMPSQIPLTTAGLESYFSTHSSNYDELCVAVAVVSPRTLNLFYADRAKGMSVAELAREHSLDSSSQKGGAYGCWKPSSQYYDTWRRLTAGLALNQYNAKPRKIAYGTGTANLFVAVTKRTPSTFADAEQLVLADARNYNAAGGTRVKENLLYRAAVSVSPAFGRWALTSSGPTVANLAVPAESDVTSPGVLAGLQRGPARYQ